MDGNTCDKILDAGITALATGTVAAMNLELMKLTGDPDYYDLTSVGKMLLETQVRGLLWEGLDVDFDAIVGDGLRPASPNQSPNHASDLVAAFPGFEGQIQESGGLLIQPEVPSMSLPLEVHSVWAGEPSFAAYQTHDLHGLDETPCSEADLVVIDASSGAERVRLPLDEAPNCAASVAVDEEAGLAYQAFSRNNKIACALEAKQLRALRLP